LAETGNIKHQFPCFSKINGVRDNEASQDDEILNVININNRLYGLIIQSLIRNDSTRNLIIFFKILEA